MSGSPLRVAAPGVLAAATGPTALAPSVVTNPSNGSVTVNADGAFTYTSAAGFTGTDSFVYQATDTSGDYAVGTVTITVSPAPVTVTFDSAGGRGSSPSSETIPSGTTATAPSDPARASYTFHGWFTAASGGTKWDFATPVTADTTLYAQWTGVPQTVTFNPQNGGATFIQAVAYGSPLTQPTAPARSGWVFDGWYTKPVGGTKWNFGTATVTSSLTLAAQWTTATVNPGTVAEGGTITVTGKGFWPGEQVHTVLHSTPTDLGTVAADRHGDLSLTATVPASFPTGNHTVILTGLTSGRSARAALTVTAAATPASNNNNTPVLADTGVDVSTLLDWAVPLLVIGLLTTLTGRRRRTPGTR
jgi:uncharacterized repeat protein (TIGR02543 family)